MDVSVMDVLVVFVYCATVKGVISWVILCLLCCTSLEGFRNTSPTPPPLRRPWLSTVTMHMSKESHVRSLSSTTTAATARAKHTCMWQVETHAYRAYQYISGRTHATHSCIPNWHMHINTPWATITFPFYKGMLRERGRKKVTIVISILRQWHKLVIMTCFHN